jgi:hypothetical protein
VHAEEDGRVAREASRWIRRAVRIPGVAKPLFYCAAVPVPLEPYRMDFSDPVEVRRWLSLLWDHLVGGPRHPQWVFDGLRIQDHPFPSAAF